MISIARRARVSCRAEVAVGVVAVHLLVIRHTIAVRVQGCARFASQGSAATRVALFDTIQQAVTVAVQIQTEDEKRTERGWSDRNERKKEKKKDQDKRKRKRKRKEDLLTSRVLHRHQYRLRHRFLQLDWNQTMPTHRHRNQKP